MAEQRYEAVIGLEVHAQLRTATKIFCGCSTSFGDPPNANVCPVCLGLPGALPVLNRRALEMAVRFGVATGCQINPASVFARKSYFYPDLPKGYQISQYELPVCAHGALEIDTEEGAFQIGIVRAHLEEDAGKSLHGVGEGGRSHLDFNRAGVPLLEIVSAPELRTPDQAVAYLRELRALLLALEICDGNMQEGSFRCDANVSIRPAGDPRLGTRTEIKNLNSFRFVGQALAFEIRRQTGVLDGGGQVEQETRLWDEAARVTRAMRGKEAADDYRYFPDPDLLDAVVGADMVTAARHQLPELPRQRRARYVSQLGLPAADAALLCEEPATTAYFEAALALQPRAAKPLANWVINEVLRVAKESPGGIAACRVTPRALAALVSLLQQGAITGPVAKDVFAALAEGRAEDPARFVDEHGLGASRSADALTALVDEVIARHPAQVAQYRAGKAQVLGFLVGQIMRAAGGRLDPKQVNAQLRARLDTADGSTP